MKENFDIFDFSLEKEEIEEIAKLDLGYSGIRAKHFDPEFIRGILKTKLHE